MSTPQKREKKKYLFFHEDETKHTFESHKIEEEEDDMNETLHHIRSRKPCLKFVKHSILGGMLIT